MQQLVHLCNYGRQVLHRQNQLSLSALWCQGESRHQMKLLITGGCSFSADNFCWPVKLEKQLNAAHHQTGIGSAGNDLISRRVLNKLLELKSYEDVLVGVMWSGYPRKSHMSNGEDALKKHKGCQSETSPFRWNDEDWLLSNPGFNDKFAKQWYQWYFNDTQALMETYEHMLRLQWFLEKNNIKYFFTTYTASALDETGTNSKYIHPLKKLVAWDKFLDVQGMAEWCKKYYPDDFPVPGDDHPGELQHNEFAAQVIVPWIKKNYDIT